MLRQAGEGGHEAAFYGFAFGSQPVLQARGRFMPAILQACLT